MDSEPEAYKFGWIPFLDLRIELGSRPLIPRPETEWWTEQLIEKIGDRPLRVLDLCAGSGAIGLAILSKCKNAQVSLGELVPEHVEQIKENIAVNAINAGRARVEVSDLFTAFTGKTFDIIATNPPYIPDDRVLDESVSKWEPREALRAGPDGLDLIRRIAQEAPSYMKPGGQLWCEVDSERGEEAKELFTRADLHNDQYGRPRILVAYY